MATARVKRNPARKYSKQGGVRWSWTERGQRRHHIQSFATRPASEAYAPDLNVQLQRGYVPNVAQGRRLLRDYAAEWLDSLVDIWPRSRERIEQTLRVHVLPEFGEMTLVEVRRADCEDYVRALRAKNLAPATIKHAYTPLVRVLDRAVASDALARNPARGVPLPTDRSTGRPKRQMAYLTPEQVGAVATVLDDQPPYGLLIRFMAFSGLRSSEVAGLDVGDVHPGRVHVHRTREKVRGGWRVGVPKSEQSTRFVPLPQWLLAELSRYLAHEHPRGSEMSAPSGRGATTPAG
jgi:integrase